MRFWFVVMVEPCQDVLGIGWIGIFTTVNCIYLFSSVNTTGKWKPPKDMTFTSRQVLEDTRRGTHPLTSDGKRMKSMLVNE